MTTSFPLAVLEIDGPSLSLRIRPRMMARLFDTQTLKVAPAEVDVVFPCRARLRWPAIGIRCHGQPPSYLVTMNDDRSTVLSLIAAAGFPVEWKERRFSYA